SAVRRARAGGSDGIGEPFAVKSASIKEGGLNTMADAPTNLPSNSGEPTPFEQIRRVNAAGNEHWSSRDFAKVLGYTDYRNFEQVVEKARLACFNSGKRFDDHFVDITEMVEI